MKFLAFSEDSKLLSQLITLLRENGEVDAVAGSTEAAPVEYGAGTVYKLNGNMQFDNVSSSIIGLMEKGSYDAVVVSSTVLGREVAGYISAKTDSEIAPELSSIEFKDGKALTRRWAFGGKTVLEEEWNAKVFTVLPGIVDITSVEGKSPVEEVQLGESAITVVNEEKKSATGMGIDSAKIIVSVGRGLGKKEGLATVETLAEAVNGEIAGSRPVCLDYQWLSEDRQVGLSGKKVKPKVYIALGISGQIQHIAGMRNSKVVVSVNKDKSAPIFEESDYGIVGDLYQVVPKLVEAIKS